MGVEQVPNQSGLGESEQDSPVEIEFAGAFGENGVAREAMMIIVQPFAQSQKVEEHDVGRMVVDGESDRSRAMAEISERGGDKGDGVGAQRSADENRADYRVRPAEGKAETSRQNGHRDEIPEPARAREEHRGGIGEKIGREYFWVRDDLVEQPAIEGVAEARNSMDRVSQPVEIRTMRVARLVRILMMAPMIARPLQDRALADHLRKHVEKNLGRSSAFKGAMNDEAMQQRACREHEKAIGGEKNANLRVANSMRERPGDRARRAEEIDGEKRKGFPALRDRRRTADNDAVFRRHAGALRRNWERALREHERHARHLQTRELGSRRMSPR